MNILNKIKRLLLKNKNTYSSSQKNKSTVSMKERENHIYGEDKIAQQRLYEKWSCKDKWLLYSEGMPLLFGIAPGTPLSPDDEINEKIKELWEHAKECVHQRLLSVTNKDLPEYEWEVKPVDLYCWATVSRISVPQEFSSLMAFVVQTVKQAENKFTSDIDKNRNDDTNYQRHRELMLGATISILVNHPELCKNNKGKIVSKKIVNQIIDNEKIWFADEKPLLAQSAMEDLINRYLKQV